MPANPQYYVLLPLMLNTLLFLPSCSREISGTYHQWEIVEVVLQSDAGYSNPYIDVDVWMVFTANDGTSMRRPAFWDGNGQWKIRFSSPVPGTVWQWESYASNGKDRGLHGQKGAIAIDTIVYGHPFLRSGTLKPSPGKRNVVRANGESFLVVGDTPWALPFRATPDQVNVYAKDRREKGFNAALLMSIQPDMKAVGPEARDTELGFMRGFEDLSQGHLTSLNVDYFKTLDTLTEILLDQHIVPVFQPVFHGFGWKGLDVLGNVIDPEEYVRYCKYLLARYGAAPAMWLIAGDNGGRDPGVKEAGEMFEAWDAYGQPVGLHYNPCDDYLAEWAVNNPLKHCMHFNKQFQEESWLDFQWAQTGHGGDHQYHKVQRMYDNLPVKAAANGEPTYEAMMGGKNGLGWWQGEEAWLQWMNGGTMGIVYGAASLWQWKVTADEEGWGEWAAQPKSWFEAMQMEGSVYAGLMGKILKDYDITDMEKNWQLAGGQPLLNKGNKLVISYLNEGGKIEIDMILDNHNYKWINPRNGELADSGPVSGNLFNAPDQNPWVLIIASKE